MLLRLKILTGQFKGKQVRIKKPRILIGRGKECAIRPACNKVSRLHCQISITDKGVWINDLNSANGTFLSGIAVTSPREVNTGDKLEIGSLLMEAYVDKEDAPETVDDMLSVLDEFPNEDPTLDGGPTRITSRDEIEEMYALAGIRPNPESNNLAGLNDCDAVGSLMRAIMHSVDGYRTRHPEIGEDEVKQALETLLDRLRS